MSELTSADANSGRASPQSVRSGQSQSSSQTSSGSEFSTRSTELDHDYSKDNVPNPVDSESTIQGDRIVYILNNAIYQTKLILSFEFLFVNTEVLSRILPARKYEEVAELYDTSNWISNAPTSRANNDRPCINVKKLMETGIVDSNQRCSMTMTRLIYVLKSYPELTPYVEKYIDRLKKEYDNEQMLTPVNLKFLILMEMVRDKMILQTSKTARAIIEQQFREQKLKLSNELHKKNIQDLQMQIEKEQKDFDELIAKRRETAENLKLELHFLRKELDNKLQRRVVETDREMVISAPAEQANLRLLKEEYDRSSTQDDKVLKIHLKGEEEAKQKRLDAEDRLKTWLEKYDEDMAKQRTVLDEFEEKYTVEADKAKGLEDDIAELDVEYIPLMEAREAEYVAEMTGKMREFMERHVTRILQYVWRTVLYNRVQKRKWQKIQAAIERKRKADRLPTL